MPPFTPQLAAGAALAALAAGFAAGWAVNGWRLSGDIERLQGVTETQQQSIRTLEGVNKSCAAGVLEVKGAVKTIAEDGARRSRQAAEAMAAAAQATQQNLADARQALARPPAKPGEECDTAAREAAAYARKRQGTP